MHAMDNRNMQGSTFAQTLLVLLSKHSVTTEVLYLTNSNNNLICITRGEANAWYSFNAVTLKLPKVTEIKKLLLIVSYICHALQTFCRTVSIFCETRYSVLTPYT